MSLEITVNQLPPKKDGANSMWRKGTELTRLKALRLAALAGMAGRPPWSGPLALQLVLYAEPTAGDLDNFITGICDGLMASHPATPINEAEWAGVPPLARPSVPIVFTDDATVTRIAAERRAPQGRPAYTLSIHPHSAQQSHVSA